MKSENYFNNKKKLIIMKWAILITVTWKKCYAEQELYIGEVATFYSEKLSVSEEWIFYGSLYEHTYLTWKSCNPVPRTGLHHLLGTKFLWTKNPQRLLSIVKYEKNKKGLINPVTLALWGIDESFVKHEKSQKKRAHKLHT